MIDLNEYLKTISQGYKLNNETLVWGISKKVGKTKVIGY